MRNKAQQGPLSVQAIAGNHVVLLGMNLDSLAAVDGLLGFAIHRTDHTENESYWLRNFITFRETDSGAGYGPHYSTQESPIQEFTWGDYTAKPAHQYTYRVSAMYGKPKALLEKHTVSVTVSTASVTSGPHAIYFNRGAAASQAYQRLFKNQAPAQVPGGKAYKWLSRGLEEGMLHFIEQAQGPGYALRVAAYEFTYLPVLKALAAAAARKVDVHIVYDARDPEGTVLNEHAIATAGLEGHVTPRATDRFIAHNKFIVLLKDGNPIEVLTGSTNFTESGVFGHSNVVHVVREPAVAKAYLAYWEQLRLDPITADLRTWNDAHSPVQPPSASIQPIFSPRGSMEALQSYAQLMDQAQSGVFMTAAFGVHPLLQAVMQEDRSFLRYILLEKDNAELELIKRDPDNRITSGAYTGEGAFANWAREKLTGLNKHVEYIHTKYLLIDPLGPSPIVITGSANFSSASTLKNDENMLIIRNAPEVADIYLTEFMRLFTHFEFRARARDRAGAPPSAEGVQPNRLFLGGTDKWARRFFVPNSVEEKERKLFSSAPRSEQPA